MFVVLNVHCYLVAPLIPPGLGLCSNLSSCCYFEVCCGPLGGHLKPSWTQDRPKVGPTWSQNGPMRTLTGRKTATRWPKMAPRWPKMAPRGPKMAPRGLKTKNAAKNIARAHTYAIFSGCAEPIDTGAGQVRGRCGAGAGQRLWVASGLWGDNYQRLNI